MNRTVRPGPKSLDGYGAGRGDIASQGMSALPERLGVTFATITGDTPLRELARYGEGSIGLLYCGGLLHLMPRDDGDALAAACFRALKPLGTVRVATIDLERIVHGYLFDWSDEHDAGASRTRRLNAAFRQAGLQFVYSEDELTDLLARVGFADIRRFDVGASSNPRFWNLEPDRTHALILEATKP
jgi:predicted SAM-dependent methyltransferase